jgi:hypothetical protein
MEELKEPGKTPSDKKTNLDQMDEPTYPTYPASIEKMSEAWRKIRRQNPDEQKGSFVERNYLVLGIGIGLLILAFLIVIGGVAFLIWNSR